ncbi:MAG: polyprenyl diphosphate synthase [Candidatus Omnitrophota bacterium]|nr:polyprenyl diphosphate synthase [Candidatus Omnitrophota bacterium]
MNNGNMLPDHIAIIMDGNGRWARARGLPKIFGHRAGASAVRRTVEACCELGIKALTLYAFSWENWDRPNDEIRDLMGLLEQFLKKEEQLLHKYRVRLLAIGRLEELPPKPLATLRAVIGRTAQYDHMTLTLAISYGGRQEIVDAARRLASMARQGQLDPAQIDETLVSQQLYTAGRPDPDLVIRTSGEQRLSNFLLWQTSYAEFYVTPKPWPEFAKSDLEGAIADFRRRERRFGKAATRDGAAVS